MQIIIIIIILCQWFIYVKFFFCFCFCLRLFVCLFVCVHSLFQRSKNIKILTKLNNKQTVVMMMMMIIMIFQNPQKELLLFSSWNEFGSHRPTSHEPLRLLTFDILNRNKAAFELFITFLHLSIDVCVIRQNKQGSFWKQKKNSVQQVVVASQKTKNKKDSTNHKFFVQMEWMLMKCFFFRFFTTLKMTSLFTVI